MGTYLWAAKAIVIIFLLIFLYVLIKVIHKKLSKAYIILPLMFIFGYVLIYVHSIPDNFEKLIADEACDCNFTGRVYKVQMTDYGYRLWLENVNVLYESEAISTQNAIAFSKEKYNRGDVIKVYGSCEKFDTATNEGEFDSRKYYQSIKVKYKITVENSFLIEKNKNYIYTLSDKIADKITKSFYSLSNEKYASVFCAMLLGNKDNLDDGIEDLFSGGGIGHILAISGLHISIMGMNFYKLIKRIGAGYILSMIISSVIIIFYGFLTGNGISTVRALIMFMLAVYSNVAGRTYDLVSGACIAGVLMLIDNPMLIYNGGFWLSFMAIAGIGGINPAIIKIFDINNSALKTFIGGISLQLGTLPVVMYLYYEVPIYSVLINLVVVPLVTYVMIAALFGGIIGCVSKFFGSFVIGIAVYILRLYEFLCEKSLELPGAIWVCGKPFLWQVILYYLILWIVLKICLFNKKKCCLIGILLCFVIIIFRFNNSFEAVFLDVGQGDGIFLRTDEATILVDGGSSDNSSLYEYTMEPFLKSKGVDEVDYAFITHTDSDHCSGIKELLKKGEIHINTLVLPFIEKNEAEYRELIELCHNCKTDIVYIYAGMSLEFNKLKITCMHPTKNYKGTDINSHSIVLMVSYEELDLLLTGDIGEQEELFINNFPQTEVLKVAHHGSKNSSSKEFLEKVKPSIAIISCGKRNSYGHPNNDTLERLNEAGSEIFCTMDRGQIKILYKNGEAIVE